MDDLIDRNAERQLLLDAERERPSLVVMIGRRRVGKSFLLSRVLSGDRTISVQGDEQSEREHLDMLAEETGRVLLGSTALNFDTWDAALTLIGEQARIAPITLILDEFQWFKSSQPAVDSIIQRHWDRWQRDRVPIMLVLSGSALTMMERLLDGQAPLYGRASARPRLQPFDYRVAAEFATTDNPEQLLRRWGVLGGTPQYQVWAGRDRSMKKIIRERILEKNAPMYQDPHHLLREGEGIRDPGTYLAILRAIAQGATQFNAISQQARVVSANLGRRLDRLEDLGYITRRFPVEASGEEKRTAYELSDPYFRFWFRYVHRNRSRLESGRADQVLDEIIVDFDNLMGKTFEECCRTWVSTYADEEVTGAPREIGSWWSRDSQTEIDIVGVRDHRYVLVGTCKWRKVADIEVLTQLRKQQHTLGPKALSAQAVIFAREGFSKRLRDLAAEEKVLLLNAADLFA